MTAATLSPPADATLIAGPRAVYDQARGAGRGLPALRRKAVADATWNLGDALEFYRLILDGVIHPLSAYEQLRDRCHPEDLRYERALAMAAQDAADEARELVKVIREHCGDETAQELAVLLPAAAEGETK